MHSFVQPNPSLGTVQRLTSEEFFTASNDLLARTQRRVAKFERLQHYLEDNRSWLEFQRGNIELSMQHLQKMRSEEANFDIDFFGRGLQFLRLRATELPLTPYLEWEFQSYILSAQYGETILITDFTNLPRDSRIWNTRDFLLFDSRAVLIHDYKSDGSLDGGWLSRDKELIEKCEQLVVELASTAVPLGVFISRHPLKHPHCAV